MTQHEELVDLLRRIDERLERIEKALPGPVSRAASMGDMLYVARRFHPAAAGSMKPEAPR